MVTVFYAFQHVCTLALYSSHISNYIRGISSLKRMSRLSSCSMPMLSLSSGGNVIDFRCVDSAEAHQPSPCILAIICKTRISVLKLSSSRVLSCADSLSKNVVQRTKGCVAGFLCHHLVRGKKPHTESTEHSLLRAVPTKSPAHGRPPPPLGVPPQQCPPQSLSAHHILHG
jgi:hypothetical protein